MNSKLAGERGTRYKIGMDRSATKFEYHKASQRHRYFFMLALSRILRLPLCLPLVLGSVFAPVVHSQQQDPPAPGAVTGVVVDINGAPVVGAHVKLSRPDSSAPREVLTGDDGQFSFANVPAGPFQIIVWGTGFATEESIGMVRSGENLAFPQITLPVATNVTEVRVTLPKVELAEAEMKAEEKQRVLGVLPNFYVSYVPDAVPLTPKQKFKLAWKATIDPSNFLVTGAVAGVQQGQNDFKGYGQGGEGFARRYGADFADSVAGTFIGGAVFPSLLKQDPRYFYKGTGGVRSRVLYAMAHSVICKGDNGHWQPNYSNFLGSLAAGGISNFYYPDDRVGAALTFENAAINIASGAAINIVQEFVMRRFTSHVPNQNSGQP
jgi:hypothetical protein